MAHSEGSGHASQGGLAGLLRDGLSEALGFRVLYVEAHRVLLPGYATWSRWMRRLWRAFSG